MGMVVGRVGRNAAARWRLLAVFLVFPLQNTSRRRTAQPLVRPVHLGQQHDIRLGVLPVKPVPPSGSRLQLARLAILSD
jgi:hypothetical protein